MSLGIIIVRHIIKFRFVSGWGRGPEVKAFKLQPSGGKGMATVFWDAKKIM
jgi:hypothetical protein